MLDSRLYRLAFAPALAAVVACAFSLESVPEPFDPGPITTEFDGRAALRAAKEIVAAAPERTPGSDGDAAAADLVAKRFNQIPATTVATQDFQVDGREARNVVLTLSGETPRTIAVIAGRDTARGEGGASSAAATGVLLELAVELGVLDLDRTVVLASTDAASEGAKGATELIDSLAATGSPVDSVLVISQPGAAELSDPHLVDSSTGERRGSLGLRETVAARLADDATVTTEPDGVLAQIARLAMPAGLGEQAPLISDGYDAIAISSAGERPLDPSDDEIDDASAESLRRFGQTALGAVAALDATAQAPQHGPETYVRFGDNVVPSWAISLLVLALLVPPIAVAVSELARARRREGTAEGALGWALSATLPPLAILGGVYLLALPGLIPDPAFPFDPGTIEIGPTEAIALLFLFALGAVAWRYGGPARPPRDLAAPTAAAAAGALAIGACLLAWLANPFLALLAVPFAHVFVLAGGERRRSLPLLILAVLVAAIPLVWAAAHVAGILGWGREAPWQLAVLVADGQVGLVPALACALLAAAAIAAVLAGRVRRDPPTPPEREPWVAPPEAA